MRLLAVTHSLGCNGAAWAMCRVLVAIKKAGGSVDLLYKGNEAFAEYLQNNGVRIIDQPLIKNYDVALVNTLFNYGWVSELVTFLPVVFWIHEGESCRDNNHPFAIRWMHAFRLSSRIIFVNAVNEFQSKTVFKSYLSGVEPRRILHVNCGIEIPPETINRLNQNKQRPSIISLGSLYPRKRPADIVEAILRMDDRKVHCTFVGSLDGMHLNAPSLQNSIAQNPNLFTLTGEIVDEQIKFQHLHDAHVFCSSSNDETFNLSAMEAAAMGLPLALSDLPCYHGIWKHGENALLAPVGAIDCLSWNLKALTQDNDLATRLGQAAMQTAMQFTLEKNLNGITNALYQAINDPIHL